MILGTVLYTYGINSVVVNPKRDERGLIALYRGVNRENILFLGCVKR